MEHDPEQHFDPKLGGVNWEGARRELRPKVEAADNEEAARTAIRELIARLGHSHVALIPREAYPESKKAKGDAEPGIEIRRIDGEFLVTRVVPGSPAEKAGIRTGWTLRQVDQTPLAQAAKASATRANWWAESLLRGQESEPIELQFTEGTYKLARTAPAGKLARFGNLPPIPLEIEFKMLPGEVGYLRLTAFFDPEWLEAELAKGIAACAKCNGFIVDVRGNPGGLGAMSATVTGWFVDKQVQLGRVIYRQMTLNMVAEPRPVHYSGPLAVLIDDMSYSTSEILAAGLKDIHRARLFGDTTGGGALPSAFVRLPNGDALQYVFANYISAGGKAPEGAGVTPDEQVRPTKAELLAGRDPVLEAATIWIKKGK